MERGVPNEHREAAAPAAVWWKGGFGRLLFGQSVSAVGSQVTFIALPMIAVLSLRADPAAMGLLGALDNLPYLLIGLWVGVFVDRHARRRLMVASDLLRAAAVVSIPIAAVAGALTFAQLCAVAFVVGVGNIVFDVACQAQLPELVPESKLVPANGGLQTAGSLAMVGAPGLVGVLITVVGAPLSMVIDTLSYLVSAVSIASIRRPEQHRPAPESSSWSQIVDGLRLVRDDRRLVGIAGGAATISIAMNAAFAVLVYYLANTLGLDAGWIGAIFLAFGVGGVVGALAVSRLGEHLGVGRVLLIAPVVAGVGLIGYVVAGPFVRASAFGVALVFCPSVVMGVGLVGFTVLAAGVRQLLAPAQARGRVLGTLRFVEWGSMPLGSVIGGAVGQWAGAPAALWVSAALLIATAGWVVATPLVRLKRLTEFDTVPRACVD